MTYVSEDDPPILIVQGTDDPLVNPENPWINQEALIPVNNYNTVFMLGLVEHAAWDSRRPITDPLLFSFMEHFLKAETGGTE